MFSPPLHSQRHQFVVDFVSKNKPLKVADLGCSECTLLQKLKFQRGIELLVGVDINGATLKTNGHRLAPLLTDYLQPSFHQRRIKLYQGSVTQKDSRLRGFDLVTGIELIEHLSLPDVGQFCDVVFGYMTPAVAIISTPNVEFNTLLPGLTGFRHYDHKFEWTRAEFQSWALEAALEYGYEVEFTGVGPAPLGQQETVGFCTQIGVFRRLTQSHETLFGVEAEDMFPFKLLHSLNYPSLRDNNTLRKFLVPEVLCFADKLKQKWIKQRSAESDGSRREVGGAKACQQASECGPDNEDTIRQGLFTHLLTHEEDYNGTQQGSHNAVRFVSVPLALLMTSPKVSALSGSISKLRQVLMEDPAVKLSQDGLAVMLKETELKEKDDEEDGDDEEASVCSQQAEQEEDWEV